MPRPCVPTSYGAALNAVAGDAENAPLVRVYGGVPQRPDARAAAGAEVDRLARKYAVSCGASYTVALNAVLADPNNAAVRAAYAGTGTMIKTQVEA